MSQQLIEPYMPPISGPKKALFILAKFISHHLIILNQVYRKNENTHKLRWSLNQGSQPAIFTKEGWFEYLLVGL